MSKQPPIEDESKELIPSWIEDLPSGIRANTGTGLAHNPEPVWDIVGNTVKVGNIMLVRLDPKFTTQSDFKTIAKAVEAILNEVASISS